MTKQHFNPPELFHSLAHGFSQVVTAQGGKTVYIAGQVAWNEAQQIVGKNDLGLQTEQTLRNLDVAVRAAGGTLADVVSLRIYYVQEKLPDTHAIRTGLLTFFPQNPPAATWIGVHSLASDEFLIEIEAIAVVA